jgi:hypothetical protein
MTEAEYPRYMERMGFRSVSTAYLTINLTPDNPVYSRETAHAIIDADRQTALDGIRALEALAPDLVTADELAELVRLTQAKYDQRFALYDAGVRQWDANVSVTQVVRGVK